ncbi:F-box only protein 4-like isoform X2 [Tachypleus tridentatus]|uniref:F-box only protein 4-like isoform X2 n=1 Tax=Tachypleus tridentatus TaxID=6853 RepID=UPI003FD42A8C
MEMASFQNLPDSLLLHIFSFLSVRELYTILRVCWRWYSVINDELYWKKLLLKECHILSITHLSQTPELIRDELNCAEIQTELKCVIHDPVFHYSRILFDVCSPMINKERRRMKTEFRDLKPKLSWFQTLTQFSKLTPKTYETESKIEKTPKVVMLGPGLDSKQTKCIASKILAGRNNIFEAISMCSGTKPGLGSGLLMKCQGKRLNFVTLYSNTYSIRERHQGNSLEQNKLFKKDGTNGQWTLVPSVKETMEDINAIIYVIDARQRVCQREELFADLHVLLHDLSSTLTCQEDMRDQALYSECSGLTNFHQSLLPPLLVLACVPDATHPRMSWEDLLSKLNLCRYKNPWHISHTDVSTLKNITIGLDWMLAHISKTST